MPQDNRCVLPGTKFCRTHARTRFGLNSNLSCFNAPLARLIRCHKKRCILWPFILMSEFVFMCKYHYVTGSQGHVRAATLFNYLNCKVPLGRKFSYPMIKKIKHTSYDGRRPRVYFISYLFTFSCRIGLSYSPYEISALYEDWKYFFPDRFVRDFTAAITWPCAKLFRRLGYKLLVVTSEAQQENFTWLISISKFMVKFALGN